MSRPNTVANIIGATLFGALLMTCSIQTIAATLSGKVIDEKAKTPLESARTELYKWNSDYNYWSYYGSKYIAADGAFKFTGLPAGTYYIFTSKSTYYAEYYNNAKDFNTKAKIILTATQNKSLGSIGLEKLPVYFYSLTATPRYLPSTGGKVTISGIISNETGATYNTKIWATLYANSAEDYYVYAPIFAPVAISIPITGLTNYSYTFSVPSTARNGKDYLLEFTLGASIWSPLTGDRTYFYKGSTTQAAFGDDPTPDSALSEALDSDAPDTDFTGEWQSVPVSLGLRRIPDRVSEDGTVLKWRAVR